MAELKGVIVRRRHGLLRNLHLFCVFSFNASASSAAQNPQTALQGGIQPGSAPFPQSGASQERTPDKGLPELCIPPKSNRKTEIPFDKTLDESRHKIETIFGEPKNLRRIHACFDRCAHAFMSAIAIATTVIFWINQ